MKINNLKAIFIFLILIYPFVFQGCDDSGIIPDPPVYDTLRYNFKNIIITEYTSSISYNSIDLKRGLVIQEANANRDAILSSCYIDTTLIKYFCLRSGVISTYALGFQTKFMKNVYCDITQYQFDTIKKIPDPDTLIGDDFTSDSTGYFTDSIPTHPVYGFYLEGKFLKGITAKPVYGIIYIDSLWNTEENISKFRVDIKINRNGENSFKY